MIERCNYYVLSRQVQIPTHDDRDARHRHPRRPLRHPRPSHGRLARGREGHSERSPRSFVGPRNTTVPLSAPRPRRRSGRFGLRTKFRSRRFAFVQCSTGAASSVSICGSAICADIIEPTRACNRCAEWHQFKLHLVAPCSHPPPANRCANPSRCRRDRENVWRRRSLRLLARLR